MDSEQTASEAEKDRRQAQEWIKPPLTTDPSPVAESSVLAATIALGEHTEELTQAVIANRNERKALQVTVLIVAVMFLAQSIYGFYALSKISEVSESNATILASVSSVTSPGATAASIARADYRMNLTIYCTNNFTAHRTDPNGVELDERCPTTFPATVNAPQE